MTFLQLQFGTIGAYVFIVTSIILLSYITIMLIKERFKKYS